MIRISLGNVGSGKTAMEVRTMMRNVSQRKTYSNIITQLPNQVTINPHMIAKRVVVGSKKRRDGSVEEITKLEVNKEFWQEAEKPLNVTIDEAHTILNARRAMSKTNVVVTDWLALIRRILGQSESGYGELVFITQLPNRLDPIARDMATQVRYHICHFVKICRKCLYHWREHSEMPEQQWICPRCRHNSIKKSNHVIEVWHFSSMDDYLKWKTLGLDSFYNHYYVKDIERVFPLYDTLQWDNLFSELYA